MSPKLLIVDDEPFTVEMLETFLQLNGFETVGAFNGEDGLVLARVEAPQIVILDLMLPDIEGYEVCKRIRQSATGATLPVLILSARAEAAAKERALAAGANSYMVKPVQFPKLLNELKRLLAPPPVAPEIPAVPAVPAPEVAQMPKAPEAATPAQPTPPTIPPASASADSVTPPDRGNGSGPSTP